MPAQRSKPGTAQRFVGEEPVQIAPPHVACRRYGTISHSQTYPVSLRNLQPRLLTRGPPHVNLISLDHLIVQRCEPSRTTQNARLSLIRSLSGFEHSLYGQ